MLTLTLNMEVNHDNLCHVEIQGHIPTLANKSRTSLSKDEKSSIKALKI